MMVDASNRALSPQEDVSSVRLPRFFRDTNSPPLKYIKCCAIPSSMDDMTCASIIEGVNARPNKSNENVKWAGTDVDSEIRPPHGSISNFEFTQTPPIAHTSPSAQSDVALHEEPTPHALHADPPQSISVSPIDVSN
jgi:hypothetical protein